MRIHIHRGKSRKYMDYLEQKVHEAQTQKNTVLSLFTIDELALTEHSKELTRLLQACDQEIAYYSKLPF